MATKQKAKAAKADETENIPSLKVQDESLTISPEDLTNLDLGDAADVENFLGGPIGDIDWDNPGLRGMAVLIFAAKKRLDPGYTLEKAKRIKVGEVTQGEPVERPTEPAIPVTSGSPS